MYFVNEMHCGLDSYWVFSLSFLLKTTTRINIADDVAPQVKQNFDYFGV